MEPFELPVRESDLFNLALSVVGGNRHVADEAVQHVRVQHWRCRYQPTKGSFRGWASRVINNYCRDLHRSRFRKVGGDATSDQADPRSNLAELERESDLDLTTPFAPEDLAAVSEWAPRQRFVVLGWAGLWGKLPIEEQDRIVAVVKPALGFPVPDFIHWLDGERTRYLAAALCVQPNSITQIRVRGRDDLLRLRFVRELSQV